MTTITQEMTAEALLHMPYDGRRYELVQGELRQRTPAGAGHGAFGMNLAGALAEHVRRQKLGRVFLAETGFKLARDPDTVRAPDIGFVRRARIASLGLPEGYFPGAPDLAVEVVSPGDTARAVREKVAGWLEAGTELVWVVYPRRSTVAIHRTGTTPTVLQPGQSLDGGQVVPGFTIPVAEIFE